ncbi:MAG: hypothetical protein IH898_03120 [Planctomycetes bacterium]|nr:hypothetical protein [Planctomycetota bacterium]
MTLFRSFLLSLSIVFSLVFTSGSVLAFDGLSGLTEHLTVREDISFPSGISISTNTGGTVTFSYLRLSKNNIDPDGEVPEPTSLMLAALAIVLAVPGRPARKF